MHREQRSNADRRCGGPRCAYCSSQDEQEILDRSLPMFFLRTCLRVSQVPWERISVEPTLGLDAIEIYAI